MTCDIFQVLRMHWMWSHNMLNPVKKGMPLKFFLDTLYRYILESSLIGIFYFDIEIMDGAFVLRVIF